jgi:uncharacterized delta-60 repeat protein
MKKILIGAVIAFGLVACTQPPQPPQPASNILGLLEVRIEGGDGQTARASASFVDPRTLSGKLGTQALTAYPYYTNPNLVFDRKIVQFTDSNDSAATSDVLTTGAKRNITAIFTVTNNTSVTFDNFTLVATSVPGITVAGTGFSVVQRGDGTAVTDPNVLHRITPGIPLIIDQLTVTPIQQRYRSFQIIEPSETVALKSQAAAFTPPLFVQPLEYGFVATNYPTSLTARHLAPGQSADVSLAYQLPKINPRSANPFAFSIYYLVVNDSNGIVSQSPAEQQYSYVPVQSVQNNPNQANLRTLDGTKLHEYRFAQPHCGIRISEDGFGKKYYSVTRGISSSPWMPALNELNCDFGASGQRSEKFIDPISAIDIAEYNGISYMLGSIGSSPNRNAVIWAVNANGQNVLFNGLGTPRVLDFGGDDTPRAIRTDSSGKIIVYAGVDSDLGIARLLPNGALDTGFNSTGIRTWSVNLFDIAQAMTLDQAGKIVVSSTSSSLCKVTRFTSTGAFDTTFDTDGIVSLPAASGCTKIINDPSSDPTRIVTAGASGTDFVFTRLVNNGSLDLGFDVDGIASFNIGANAIINDLKISPIGNSEVGKIIATGSILDSTNPSLPNRDIAIARMSILGTPDSSFSSDGKLTLDLALLNTNRDDQASSVILEGNQIYVLATTFGNLSPARNGSFAIVRFSSDGTLDTTFNSTGKKLLPNLYGGYEQMVAAISNGFDILLAGKLENTALNGFVLQKFHIKTNLATLSSPSQKR